jgi:hypothetical protein
MPSTNKKENVLGYVQKCIRRNKDARRPLEWRWYENAAFAAGFTGVQYDPLRQRPIASGGASDPSSNPQVQDKLRKYHAKLIAPRMMPECIPGSNDRDARQRADVANSLILHFFEQRESVYSRHSAMMNMMIFGNGFWATQWDPNTGEWVEHVQYDQDQPVYDVLSVPDVGDTGDPSLVDMPFREEKSVRTVRWQTGLPRVRSVHPFNFFPDPHWRHLTIEQCKNYAERKLIPVDLLKFYFPEVDMDKIPIIETPEDSFLFSEVDDTFGLRGPKSSFEEERLVEVWDFYHAPFSSPQKGLDFQKGMRCVLIGDQIMTLVEALPYNDYPHATFRDRQYTDRGWGLAVTDVLRQAQKRLDLVERIEIRAAERTADPPLLKPQGSNDTPFQGRPGEVYEYVPYGEEKPSYMIPPQLSPHIFQMRSDAMADLEALSLTASPVGGTTPSRGDSAAYLDRLLEENQVAMAPTVQEIETAQAHQATHLIRLCQDHLPIGYKFAISGVDKQARVAQFDGVPFNLVDIRMVPGSAAMTYPNQIRSAVMQLAANGLLAESNPKTDAVVELLLGAPVASKLTDLEEPGDKAVAEINIQRVTDGKDPFFKPWMDHNKHIGVLLIHMRDPKFFLELTIDQQTKLEQLLQQHQAAIAPNQGMPMEQQEAQLGSAPELEAIQGGGMGEGAPATGPAMTPAIAAGFAGELGTAGTV